MTRRVAWVFAAGMWLFWAVSLVSFNPADAPSHVVAIHNDPPANLCGVFGAIVSYWSLSMLGSGVWVLLFALLGYLAVTVTGKTVSHPFVRLMGVLLMALGFSCLHGLVAPNVGSLAGAHAGLLASIIVPEMIARFSPTGSFLAMAVGFGIGAVVAVDRLVLAAPRLALHGVRKVSRIRVPRIRAWRSGATDGSTLAPPSKLQSRRDARRKADSNAAIDPDAGGVGATDAFDPDDYVVEDDSNTPSRSHEDDDYEYEYVDEHGNPIPADELDEYELEDGDDEDVEDAADDGDADEPAEPIRRLSEEELRAKIAKLPLRIGSRNKKVARDEDIPREENFESYQFPTIDLLEHPESNYSEKMESLIRKQAEQLEGAMNTYGIDGEVTAIESGPAVTLYSVQLAPGTKVSKLQAVAQDIARTLSAQNIRIVPTMKGKTTVGIEVPNPRKERVRLKELMSGGHASKMGLPMFLGKDAAGEPVVADLTKMPHMLIAGTTGSGKSVCMNSIIMSWLYTKRPDELKLVLVDPKMVELSQFADIPHLMCPVVTEMGRATSILEWAVNKMEERYELLREARVRDVVAYNALTEEELYELFEAQNDLEKARIPKKLPYMVFIIDELADLILTNKEVEQSIVRIAQKARAVGIHLILATQRPQANVVTGLIKSNMPCRVSFKVASGMDSRIVLDHKGAELLLGQGDMLILTPSTSELTRAQGTLVEDSEIRRVVKFIKNIAAPNFERSLMSFRPGGASGDGEHAALDDKERDPMFNDAVDIMLETGRGSVSLLQRRLAIGYTRASRLVEQMYQAGFLGDHKGSVAREVTISKDDWERIKALEAEAEAEADAHGGGGGAGDSQDDVACGNVDDYEDDAVPAELPGEYRR